MDETYHRPRSTELLAAGHSGQSWTGRGFPWLASLPVGGRGVSGTGVDNRMAVAVVVQTIHERVGLAVQSAMTYCRRSALVQSH
jgi:hypothetical protein